MTVLMQTDFPDPVAPAMRQCGILLKSLMTFVPGNGFAQKQGDMHFAWGLVVILVQFFEADLLRIEGRDLDADGGFAWNGGDDPDRLGLQIEGDVIFERLDLLHFHPDGRMDLKRGDRRSAVDLAHFRFDPEAQQRLFEDLRLPLEIFF